MTATGLSLEFRLVAACCRPRARPDFAAVVAAAAKPTFDPAALLTMARAHRVEGFVEEGLNLAGVTLPPAAHETLKERAAGSRLQLLRNAGEEVRVARLFRDVGIEPIFVKGATLSMLAHGSLALKTSWDIDMLIAPADVAVARTLLSGAGYRLDLPGIDAPHLIDRYIDRNKEATWINDARRTALELHTALVDPAGLLRGVGPGSPTQKVAIAGEASLTTFADDHLFAYLCVHGTMHRWERLKWVTDVAALLESERFDAEALYRASFAFGAERSVATALVLCADVLAANVPAPLIAEIGQSRATRLLVGLSFAALKAVDAPSAVGQRVELTKLWAKTLQSSGLRAQIAALGSILMSSTVASRLAIPRAALPFHALIWWPLRFLGRPWRNRQSSGGKVASRP